MKLRRLLALLVAPVSLLLGSPFVGTAHAIVMCGDVLTANTTLTADVGPCAGNGLVIGASSITLDLNGHRLFGTSGPTSTLDIGVGVVLNGFNGVTVTSSVAGGQIDHFNGGVRISGNTNPSGNTVSNLNIHDNFSEDPSGADDGEGVSIIGSLADNNTVQNNTIAYNGPYGGVSVYNGTSADKITGTVITNNNIHDNRYQSSQTIGVRLENWTWSSTVSNNTIRRSSLEGVSLFADTDSNTVSGNTITDNGESGDPSHRPGDGVHMFARSNNHTITNNTVNHNGGNGIVADTANSGNSITNNTALNNGTNPLILVEQPPLTIRIDVRASATVGGVTVTVPPGSPVPPGGPYYDLRDGSGACTANTWSGNTYGTKNPACIS